MKFVATNQGPWRGKVRIFGVSGVGEDGLTVSREQRAPPRQSGQASVEPSQPETSCPKHLMLSGPPSPTGLNKHFF